MGDRRTLFLLQVARLELAYTSRNVPEAEAMRPRRAKMS